MFDVIGYWGVLTFMMIFPIVTLVWLFTEHTNKRIRELGGKPVAMFVALDKALDAKHIGIPVILGTIVGVILSAIWAIGKMVSEDWVSYIGWFSTISEKMSPFSGFVIVFVLAFIAYDMALKGYVRVTKLVNKLEEKSES